MALVDSFFFDEDEVFRITKKGTIQFGTVIENSELLSSNDESDEEFDSDYKMKKGHIRVAWHPSGYTKVIPEKMVGLADRSLMPGDVVKNLVKEKHTQRGYCSNIKVVATAQIVGTNLVIENLPTSQFSPLGEFSKDLAVYLDHAVGVIRDVQMKLLVAFSDGSTGYISDPSMLKALKHKKTAKHCLHGEFPRKSDFYPGQILLAPRFILSYVQWVHKIGDSEKLASKYKHLQLCVQRLDVAHVDIAWRCTAFTGSATHPVQNPRASMVTGKDLERLRVFNHWSCTMQLGDRVTYTPTASDTLLPLDVWKAMKRKQVQTTCPFLPVYRRIKRSKEISSKSQPDTTSTEANSKPTQCNRSMTSIPGEDGGSNLDDGLPAILLEEASEGNSSDWESDQSDSTSCCTMETSSLASSSRHQSESSTADLAPLVSSLPVQRKQPANSVSVAVRTMRRKMRNKQRSKCKKQDTLLMKSGDDMSKILGRQCVVEILCTQSRADVVWQDGSVENDISSMDLYPIHHLDDKEFFPGDFVVRSSCESELIYSEYGVVQQMHHLERTAKVQWFEANTDVDDVRPHYRGEEEMSVYDIKDHPDYQFRPGSVVMNITLPTNTNDSIPNDLTSNDLSLNQTFEEQLESLVIQMRSMENQPESMENRAQCIESMRKFFKNNLQTWKHRLNSIQYQPQFPENELQSIKYLSHCMENQLKSLQNQLESLSNQLQTLEKKPETLINQLQSLSNQLQTLDKEPDILINQLQSLSNQLQTLKTSQSVENQPLSLENQPSTVHPSVDLKDGAYVGQVLDNFPGGKIKVCWVDGTVSSVWPQQLYKIGDYSSDDGQLWAASTDDSWESLSDLDLTFESDVNGTEMDMVTEDTHAESVETELFEMLAKFSRVMNILQMKASAASFDEEFFSCLEFILKSLTRPYELLKIKLETDFKMSSLQERMNSVENKTVMKRFQNSLLSLFLLDSKISELLDYVVMTGTKTGGKLDGINETNSPAQQEILKLNEKQLAQDKCKTVGVNETNSPAQQEILKLNEEQLAQDKCKTVADKPIQVNVKTKHVDCEMEDENCKVEDVFHKVEDICHKLKRANCKLESVKSKLQDDNQKLEDPNCKLESVKGKLEDDNRKLESQTDGETVNEKCCDDEVQHDTQEAQCLNLVLDDICETIKAMLLTAHDLFIQFFYADDNSLCQLITGESEQCTEPLLRNGKFMANWKYIEQQKSGDRHKLEDCINSSDKEMGCVASDALQEEDNVPFISKTEAGAKQMRGENSNETKTDLGTSKTEICEGGSLVSTEFLQRDTVAIPPGARLSAPVSSAGCEQFQMLESLGSYPHHFGLRRPQMKSSFKTAWRREVCLLQSSLPQGIWVRAFEDRLDLLSVMIEGPRRTPYEDGLFYFDFHLPCDYPYSPPFCHYISYCSDRLNPNLYETGKVCVSLLGTWSGRGTEVWTKQSTVLQILISIQGLILNAEPYYNEAGYEKQRNFQHGHENARMYNEMVILKLVTAMQASASSPPSVWKAETREHFRNRAKRFADRLEYWITASVQMSQDESQGARVPESVREESNSAESRLPGEPAEPNNSDMEPSEEANERRTSCEARVKEHEHNASSIRDHTNVACDTFELPQFPLLPASRGFRLTLQNQIGTFRTWLNRWESEEDGAGQTSCVDTQLIADPTSVKAELPEKATAELSSKTRTKKLPPSARASDVAPTSDEARLSSKSPATEQSRIPCRLNASEKRPSVIEVASDVEPNYAKRKSLDTINNNSKLQ